MKKIKNMFHQPKVSIFFYVMAFLCFCYTIYTGYISYQYIVGLVSQGSITWGSSIGDIIGYLVTNSSAYLFYTLAFIFFGYACNFFNPKPKKVEMIEELETVLDEEVNIIENVVEEEINSTENIVEEVTEG